MTKKNLAYVVFGISSFASVLGLLVITGVVSSKYVWGGKITDHSQMLVFESITLAVNALIIWIVGMRAGVFHRSFSDKLLSIFYDFIIFVMVLNTFGNLAAKTTFENFMAIPTALTAVCMFAILKKRSS